MSNQSEASMRILMLDDDPEDAYLVKTAIKRIPLPLSFEYFQTSEAFSQYLQQAVLENVRGEVIVLLLDLNMPCKGGLDWLEELRSDSRYESLVIVVFSTSNMEEERARSLALGANDHLGKPDSVQELAHRLTDLYQHWIGQCR
ncbi:MAG: hypothetical protein DSY86_09020 [Marinomonas sp.]|nr:MAG: hypothetical protein DSY86_09020 [Marinomonas sp.]